MGYIPWGCTELGVIVTSLKPYNNTLSMLYINLHLTDKEIEA